MGAKVEERPDGLRVEGRSAVKLARRRNRSSAAITASPCLRRQPASPPSDTRILDADWRESSYPTFFSDSVGSGG